ncbi:Protein of unknown function DUF4246 [Penicillium brevicompactum]|uniref:Protein of unknown function DUF4246 n=1 Tax=Penicillium brevicompactum TaxID=5074 RepID=UPI00254112AA|nr:Protein of unknown function DUF4246 [Penicillium brevicompactum]KAJ5318946.1 Protein of unknown function DUF4246 [Penicillium brevicompactum]
MSSDISLELRMPGFNLKLDTQPERCVLDEEIFGFPNALDTDQLDDGYISNLVTHREILMMRIMNTITEKPQWEEKVFNGEITSKWRGEIAQSGQDVSPKMIDWIMKELQYKADIFKKNGYVHAFDAGVVRSDTAVSEEIRQALKQAVHPLESIPEDQKDYHPGSEDKVVDIVHPSLFPVVYGRTHVLPDKTIGLLNCLGSVGQGEVIPADPAKDTHGEWTNDISYSNNFQWLPCDVELIDDNSSRIVSYINNAHPIQHKALYGVIEELITRAIPLWNKSLSYTPKPRIKYSEVKYGEHPDGPEPEQPTGEDYDEEAFWESVSRWNKTQPVLQPEPEDFVAPRVEASLDLRKDFPDTKLQVIVKLANIELNPDNASYDGGSWHIEGQLNERICATAIYYYDCENITENTLAFRQRGLIDMLEIGYQQGEYQFLQDVYGFPEDVDGTGDCHITQDIGAVICKQGRLLTFPNTVQHRVSPFSLADPSKPGHRKILALFLVDPHRRIISSANVPPQREDWSAERQEAVDQILSRLPRELQDIVQSDMDPLMTMQEAKDHRHELMKERGLSSGKANELFETGDFNLCEH